jgi:hypothetical protein
VCEAAPDDWDPATTAAYQARMLAKMGDKSGIKLRNLATKTVLELDPARAEERKARTIANRQVRIFHGDAANAPGTASVSITDIDATDALAVHQRISAIALALRTDTPGTQQLNPADKEFTLDRLCADVAVMLLLGRLPVTMGTESPSMPPSAGSRTPPRRGHLRPRCGCPCGRRRRTPLVGGHRLPLRHRTPGRRHRHRHRRGL